MENIKISDTKPLSINEVWAKFTAVTLENERLKSELWNRDLIIKMQDASAEALNKLINFNDQLLKTEREEHKRILAETVKNIREITYPELGNIK